MQVCYSQTGIFDILIIMLGQVVCATEGQATHISLMYACMTLQNVI